VKLSSIRPAPNTTTPMRMMLCGPKRSMIQPITGPRIATSICCSAAAPESAVLLQPRSSRSTAT